MSAIRLSPSEDLMSRLVGRATAIEMTTVSESDRTTARLLREAAAAIVRRTNRDLSVRILAGTFPEGIRRLEAK